MSLTDGELRALKAVASGDVVRVYKRDGNVFRAKGIGAQVLWRLAARRLIEDGPDRTAGLDVACTQVVTKAGEQAFADATR